MATTKTVELSDLSTMQKPPATNGYHPETVMPKRRTYSQMTQKIKELALRNYNAENVADCLEQSESGDARLLWGILENTVTYDHQEKKWFWYNNLYWEPDTSRNISQLASDLLSGQYSRLFIETSTQALETEKSFKAQDNGPSQSDANELAKVKALAKLARDRAIKLCKVGEVKNVLEFACAGVRLGFNGEWDAIPYVLPVANGIIDLKTGSLIEPSFDQHIRSVAPVDFNGLDAPAQRFQLFLSEIFARNEDVIGYIWRLFGYSLTGTAQQHIFPIFHGADGRNGKDTLMETLATILGNSLAGAVSKDVVIESKGANTGAATPHLMALRGKRLAWASEPKEGERLTEGQIKMVTGGGRIAGRALQENEINFLPTHLLILLTNHAPHAPTDDSALWERVKLIEFAQRFVDKPKPELDNEHPQDPELKQKLQAESSGILAWLVRGCLEYQKKGLMEPQCIRDATAAYRDRENTLGIFIEECCLVDATTVGRKKARKVGVSQLYKAYSIWCEQNNLRPMNGVSFGLKMAKKYEKIRGNSGFIYVRIGLLAR